MPPGRKIYKREDVKVSISENLDRYYLHFTGGQKDRTIELRPEAARQIAVDVLDIHIDHFSDHKVSY